jgi:Zn finger protein HypA/HybF involved in hydrogenase expression
MPTDVNPAAATQDARPSDVKACPTDLSIQCPNCDTKMQAEHAHYRCPTCGYRDSCCM